MLSVGILGCGPTGYAAAWAAIQRGHQVTFYSIEDGLPQPSERSAGVFVLHESMDLPLPCRVLTATGFGGNAADYAHKLYGRDDIATSFPEQRRDIEVYPMKQALDFMYEIVSTAGVSYVKTEILGIEQLDGIAALNDVVISTIPLRLFYPADCLSRKMWVTVSAAPPDENWLMYNAHPLSRWYRASAAFGRFTMEWLSENAAARAVENATVEGRTMYLHPVEKVIERQRSLPKIDKVNFLGRYGAWDKKLLTHDVWHRAHEVFANASG